MYIRRAKKFSKKSRRHYHAYRLVESVRTCRGVKQKLLLSLGNKFSVPKEDWHILCIRIEEILSGQLPLLIERPDLEAIAQRYARKLTIKKGDAPSCSTRADLVQKDQLEEVSKYVNIDVYKIKNSHISSIGGEYAAMQIIEQIGLDGKLRALGFNTVEVAATMGAIVGRMLYPGSEHKTLKWLQENSGLGELIQYDFHNLSLDKFYRIGDTLLKNKDVLEAFLYSQEQNMFNFKEIVTLYDLTNTYFEGNCKHNDKAKFGRSKEKRKDCRLVTMGLVLNQAGFPRRSELLPGNISEAKTLEAALKKLEINKGVDPMIIMDAGIATEENLKYLVEQKYQYIVVSRKRNPVMPEEGESILVKEEKDNIVQVKLIDNKKTGERELYCHSTGRPFKSEG